MQRKNVNYFRNN